MIHEVLITPRLNSDDNMNQIQYRIMQLMDQRMIFPQTILDLLNEFESRRKRILNLLKENNLPEAWDDNEDDQSWNMQLAMMPIVFNTRKLSIYSEKLLPFEEIHSIDHPTRLLFPKDYRDFFDRVSS